MFKKLILNSTRNLLFTNKLPQLFSKLSQKVMFRVYSQDQEKTLFYFDIDTSINKIQKVLNNDMGTDL